MKTYLGIFTVVVAIALGLGACGEKKAATPAADATKEKASAEGDAKEKDALDTAIEAYVYAYPLVTMESTRRALTNTAAPEGTKAPMGQFVRLREYPNASFNGANNFLLRSAEASNWASPHHRIHCSLG